MKCKGCCRDLTCWVVAMSRGTAVRACICVHLSLLVRHAQQACGAVIVGKAIVCSDMTTHRRLHALQTRVKIAAVSYHKLGTALVSPPGIKFQNQQQRQAIRHRD